MSQASLLLVEDEALIRLMLVDLIKEFGHKVVAEAGTVEEGCALAESAQYDLAIIDMNLNGVVSNPVAEVVASRGLPVLFLAGYGAKGLPDGFEGAPVLAKPCTPEVLERTISSFLSKEKKPPEQLK